MDMNAFQKQMRALLLEQDRNICFFNQHPYHRKVVGKHEVHRFVVYREIVYLSVLSKRCWEIRFCDSDNPLVKKELYRLADRQHILVDVFARTLNLASNTLDIEEILDFMNELRSRRAIRGL